MRERRRRFVESLQQHPLIEDVDFSRDGYQTVVLHLVTCDQGDEDSPAELDQCAVCGAVGLEERIESHDCEGFIARRADQ